MNIKSATREDIDQISSLASYIWHNHYPGIISEEQIRYMLQLMYSHEVIERELFEGIDYLLIYEEKLLIGYASYGPGQNLKEAKIHKLYIHPDYQGKGIGQSVVEDIEDKCRGKGYEILTLSVNKRNSQAIRAYERYGFKISESVEVDIGNNFIMDDYVMRKTLF
jgi:diamine N-acetyltransferase